MKYFVILLVLVVAISATPYGENERRGGSLGRQGGQTGFGGTQGQSGFGSQGRQGGTFREGGIANSQGAGRHGNIGGYPGTYHGGSRGTHQGGYQSHGY
ncbi:tenecin-3 [Tribolium castaneum]|uniref:Uncharacterized protein n=1 Tax=Tribolium castaneum TaxID=7070 RepID=D6WRH1_TRICA|nr:PREDICTED: tenecin-3 [Tribolium castaneum]EFA06452.1 hypothetical protein TcasGA2_TC009334 [Tribolium castaneum]|eukprot:XP_976433.1 PREDICTED: tenecin-3 [Tribolium castaneum]